ncbi:hypothetical protein GCM10010207_25340 [Streptomyces atratus]|nr:hypothetical protein GCM10010207_25340 [Streptomyces atratus]
MVLIGGTSADADGADEPAVAVDRDTTGDEEQRPFEGGRQGVEEPTRLDRIDEVGGGGIELKDRVCLAGADLTRDENGPVVPPKGQQVATRVKDRDGNGDTGGFGGAAGRFGFHLP